MFIVVGSWQTRQPNRRAEKRNKRNHQVKHTKAIERVFEPLEQ